MADEIFALSLPGGLETSVKQYSDGDIILTQGLEKIYLTVRQIEMLQNFINARNINPASVMGAE